MIYINNNVILLDRHNINVPTDITAENAYDFVLALTEKNQHAIPFYLLLDIAPNSDFPLFSIYSYEKMGNSGLFCVHTYDFCKEYVVQSKYIANAQNFKDWAPNLWLSSDSGFSQKAKRVYAGALLDIKFAPQPSAAGDSRNLHGSCVESPCGLGGADAETRCAGVCQGLSDAKAARRCCYDRGRRRAVFCPVPCWDGCGESAGKLKKNISAS